MRHLARLWIIPAVVATLANTCTAQIHSAFIRDEMAEFMENGYWAVLPYRLVRELEALQVSPSAVKVERDRKLAAQVAPYEAALRELTGRADPSQQAPERERLRWMIEEYRISLFAQQLGTVGPVSRKRLEKLWEELPR